MSTYSLFAWGANSHGQLGIGSTKKEEILVPQEVDLTHLAIDPSNICKIVGGAGHSLLLDTEGLLYSCGWNDKGQTGTRESNFKFQMVDYLKHLKVTDIACGWDSSMALTKTGLIYSWGSNSHGQLGITSVPMGSKIDVPQKVDISSEFVQNISLGLRHSAIVTKNGSILVCGDGKKGQLGTDLNGKIYSDTFIKIPELTHVIDVACGQQHTVAITKNNELYAWGNNKHGQLGINPINCKFSMTPTLINSIKEIGAVRKIQCGWTHTSILNYNNKVFLWGRNSYGQLGRTKSSAIDCEWIPKAVSISNPVKSLSTGSEHSIVITGDGLVWSWGWNEHGNCGNGKTQDVHTPTQVLLPKGSVELLGSGAGHSFAVIKKKS